MVHCGSFHAGSSTPDDTSHNSNDLSYLSQRSYWEQRYKESCKDDGNGGTFDWLVTFDSLQGHLLKLLAARRGPAWVMDLGCGTSTVVSQLINSLHGNKPGTMATAVCVDFSVDALAHQQQRKLHCNQYDVNEGLIQYVQADILKLPFRSHTMDVILDKGTVDSVLKDPENGTSNAGHILKDCLRILKPSGVLIQITDEDPDLRMNFLEFAARSAGCRDVKITFTSLESNYKGMDYFMYFVARDQNFQCCLE